ncbi:profilin [Grosmannia clavigera kw1407]|uniref:Profilin n=1 Tax=Grosmannia clavigera (strain kw1407 / UAMH 11150) TaxID=655863 RepID=F0XHV8_GROCL|nr:profilin [Grosmannia clavigera kw1407]EFX03070.1 profilin [Grosmannia clavigera kw1407]
MSWQAYVDSSLVGTGHIDKGTILSVAGDSAWATTSGFNIQPAEMKQISSILSGDKNASDKAFQDGVHVAGERYVATSIDSAENVAIFRKGKEGIIMVKSKQAIVVGHYGEMQQPGNARSTVEALGDYLRKAGY